MSSARESVNWVGIAIAILIVGLAGSQLVVAATSPEYQQQMERNAAEAEAYCAQVYGDGATYSAAATGGHGGLHCIANTDHAPGPHGPHLHEIPEEYKQRALAAERNGTDLGWTVYDAARHDSEKPDEIPLLGIYPRNLPIYGGVTLGVLGTAVGLGVVQRWRQE